MSRRRQSVEDATINLTPMIDVVFLLVIFFMVGSKFSEAEQRVDLSVSGADMRSIARMPDERVIEVHPDGSVLLDGVAVSDQALADTLRAQQQSYPSLRVAVRGDAEVSHGRMNQVYRILENSGVQQIGVSAGRLHR